MKRIIAIVAGGDSSEHESPCAVQKAYTPLSTTDKYTSTL